MRILKYIAIVLGVLLLGVGALAFLTYQEMREIPALDPSSQIVSKVYDDQYLPAIKASRELLAQARQDLSAPALSLAISVKGELVWAEALGVTDLDSNAPVTLESRFAIGSVSKTLTAVAAALLFEADTFDLDADVRTYVPTFPEKTWVMTTRQLLSHQAGIRHYEFARIPPTFSETGLNEQFDSVEDSLSIFADDDLLFEPDSSFSYSTYGYTLASAALEGASGQPFLDLLQTSLFDPLQMTHTSADFSDRTVENRVSDYFQLFPEGGLLPAPETNVSYKWAGGGIASTPSDLVRFGSALLAGHIVEPETLNELFTPRALPSGELNPQHYGLGWRNGGMYYPSDSETIITMINHGGTAVGGVAILILMPDSGVVIAMCANSSSRTGSNAIRSEAAAIVRIFLDHMTSDTIEGAS